MKHKAPSVHHALISKRTPLEFSGLAVLVYLSFQQRETLYKAVATLRDSQLLYVVSGCLLYWVLLPLTSYSYRLLSTKHVPIVTTLLAQLAASGPGRVIPGGLGHAGFGALNLRRLGYTVQEAITITVANNIIGFIANLALVIGAIALSPTLEHSSFNTSTKTTLIFLLLTGIFIVFLVVWLSRLSQTKKRLKKFTRQWSDLTKRLVRNPQRIFFLLLIASAIAIGHAVILLLSGKALHVSITLSDALIALGVGVAAGGALPTPGGLGAVEAGTISSLIALGYDPVLATSATLLFRIATYWQPLLPGLISYLYLRKKTLL